MLAHSKKFILLKSAPIFLRRRLPGVAQPYSVQHSTERSVRPNIAKIDIKPSRPNSISVPII